MDPPHLHPSSSSVTIHHEKVIVRHIHHVGGVGEFGNLSFLDNTRAFMEAEKARMAYMREHMRLVVIRARAAKAYFGAKARAAALLIIRNRFDSVLRSWVVKHKDSIKDGKMTRIHMRLAWDARLKAEKHHRISMAALHLARHHESEAKERWEHAQEVMSKADSKFHAAEKAHHHAHDIHVAAEKIDNAMLKLKKEAHAWYKKTVAFEHTAHHDFDHHHDITGHAEEHEEAAHHAKDHAIALHLKMKNIHKKAHFHMESTAASRRAAHAHLDASIKKHIKAMDNRHRLFKAAKKAHRHVVSHATKNMRHM